MGRASAFLALTMLVLLMLAPASPASAQEKTCAGPDRISLFLDASSTLSPAPPASEGSAPIPARVGGPLVWLVGTWNSRALGAPLSYSGSVNFSIWARATGAVQLSCRFQVYVGVNDQRPDTALNTNTARLTSSPAEFTGSGEVQLSLSPGDTIGFWVYAHERGGGGELLYGGSYLSRLELELSPLTVNLSAESRPGELRTRGNVTDFWGPGDVTSVDLAILGPFPGTTGCGLELLENRTRLVKLVEEIPTDEADGELSFSYVWRYDEASVSSGAYAIAVVVRTLSNTTAGADAWVQITRSGGAGLGGPVLIAAAVVALAAVGGGAVYVYRSKRGLRFLASRRSAALALGAVVISVVALAGIYVTMAPAPAGSEMAPDFTLRDTKGATFSLSGFRGRVVVLDMMATWCPTCNQEIPELVGLHRSRPDAVIVSIDVDRSESAELLESHMRSRGADWTLATDTDNVMQKYGVTEIPKIVVVDPGGRVTFAKAELVKSDELVRAVEAASTGSAPILALGGETGFAALAFLAGVSAFFSPCAFPLLPGYMSYYIGRSGDAAEDRKATVLRAAVGGAAAALGVLVVYALIGALVAGAGAVVKSQVGLLTPVVAAIVIFMGILMLTPYSLPTHRLSAPLRPILSSAGGAVRRVTGREVSGGYAGLMGYGAGYGAASLGCHAPIFIAVVALGLAAGGFGAALLAFLLYGAGMGLFMVLVTVLLGLAKERLVKRMQGWMPVIKKASGVALVVVGVVVLYSYFISLAA
ncbi:MAG: redoxin domain-containing protein [Thermoplasmatota archaeon]